jgi:hypothetical protein
VPIGRYCVRCGEPLPEPPAGLDVAEVDGAATVHPPAAAPTRRRLQSFAAAPAERVLGPNLVSTLFPRLPRAQFGSFRIALAIGVGLVGGLVVAGLYPVALGVAVAIVPALILVYIQAVDVYEGEPLVVVGATVLWGVVAGGLFGFATAAGATTTPGTAATLSAVLERGVALPAVGLALAMLGPLALLRRVTLNDVLDGVTFGAASGSAFVGAQTLAGASDLLSGGLRPVGAAGPWLVQVLTVGVAQPILAAAVTAIVAGAIWLRVRAPARDHRALGPLGDPVVAAIVGAAALSAAALGRTFLTSLAALAWLLVLTALALTWMRMLIHLGLLQEMAEIPIGAPITCPDCGQLTPHHSFCAACGISLHALPRERHPAPDGAPDVATDVAPDRDPE